MSLGYIGSKKSLIGFIEKSLANHINLSDSHTFADLFAGTGFVGEHFYKNHNFQIKANDLEYYSYIICYAKLKCVYTDKLELIIDSLNKRKYKIEINTLIRDRFSPYGDCERMFFTIENAKFIDYCMSNINNLLTNATIDFDESIFLKASLLCSLDKCANTASVYGAYLKKFKKSALASIIIEPIHTNTILTNENSIYNDDILNLQIETDILYLDPPYNQRQYSANYSQLNYILNYDNSIEISGKTGLIKNWNRSSFCSKKKIKESINAVLTNIKSKILAFSYNNEGLITKDELNEIFQTYFNKITVYEHIYKKFNSNSIKNDNVVEYLFVCE